MFKYNFLVDSHCHLNSLKENGIMLDEIINNSLKNNVKIINNICTKIQEAQSIIDITNKYDNVYCSIGHHPEETDNKLICINDLLKYKNYNKIIAIGESGLDYYYREDFNKQKQKENFIIHVEVARQLKLPLIIHSRNADHDMMDILNSEAKDIKFILHCFSSGEELALTALKLGGYISFSGILTFKNAINIQNIAKKIPLNRILVETDAPYLAPIPYRGKMNQPAYTKNIAEFLANLLNRDFFEIQSITTENFFRLFNLNY